jgi:hypothetical protein
LRTREVRVGKLHHRSGLVVEAVLRDFLIAIAGGHSSCLCLTNILCKQVLVDVNMFTVDNRSLSTLMWYLRQLFKEKLLKKN